MVLKLDAKKRFVFESLSDKLDRMNRRIAEISEACLAYDPTKIEDLEFQAKVVDAGWAYYQSAGKLPHFAIAAAPAAGKTIIAGQLAQKVFDHFGAKRPVLFICPSPTALEDVIEDSAPQGASSIPEKIRRVFGERALLSTLGGKGDLSTAYDVIFATPWDVRHLDDYLREKLLASLCCIIVDEARQQFPRR